MPGDMNYFSILIFVVPVAIASAGVFVYERRRRARRESLRKEKRELEEELTVSLVKYETLVNTIDGIVWEANVGNPGFVFVSPQAEKITGYPCKRWLEEPRFWQKLLHPEDLERITGDRYLHPEQKKDTQVEYRIITADGRVLWMSDHIKVIEEGGRARKMRGVMVDISERKRAAEELALAHKEVLEAVRVKSEFLANMSHEIRTPLNAIVGMSSIGLEYQMNEDVRDCMTTVKTAADSLLMLINDILDFSKIEAGKIELENSDFRLKSLCRNALDVINPLAIQKGLALSLQLSPKVPQYLRGDSGRILQILMNMLSNAVKFTARGGSVCLSVEPAVNSSAERNRLRIVVADNGVGISPEAVSKLFQPFTQADTTMARRYGGTGLGLSICKRLVELMGGKIGVESEQGSGSTFWFELELEEGRAETCAASEEEELAPTQELSNARVLVVDDNPANLKLMKTFLNRLGFKQELVGNGKEAIDSYRSGAFDLILMDCQMPELDGYEATKTIRKLEGKSGRKRIPILALTAHAMSGDKEKCLASGMDDYLTKPISIRDLRVSLHRWLAKGKASKTPVPDAAGAAEPKPIDATLTVDFDYLRDLDQLNTPGQPDLATELIQYFMQSAPERMAAIEQALAAHDLEVARREAHSFKSTCHNVGARSLAKTCERIETARETAGVSEAFSALKHDLESVSQELRKFRKGKLAG